MDKGEKMAVLIWVVIIGIVLYLCYQQYERRPEVMFRNAVNDCVANGDKSQSTCEAEKRAAWKDIDDFIQSVKTEKNIH